MGIKFNRDGAKRIAKATQYVERIIQNPPAPVSRVPVTSAEGFWASIGQGADGKYSWTKCKHLESLAITTDTNWGTGSHIPPEEGDHIGYAVEAFHKSENVISGDIVWLVPARGNLGHIDFFVFQYCPNMKFAVVQEDDTITAMGIANPGSGPCTIRRYHLGTDVFLNGPEITVKNCYSTEITGEKVITIEYTQGDWWVTGVDCNEDV